MTAQADIIALGADHLYDFDGDSNDGIGSVNGTNTSVLFTSGAIALDASNCMETNALTDRVTLASTTEINNSAQQRKAVAGFCALTTFNAPPTRIYGEGTEATAFQICAGFGNNLIAEVIEPTNFPTGLQIFGPAMVPNRVYHLCAIFLGNTQGNEFKFFVDGVEQFNADPLDRQPDTADLNLRAQAIFGDPSGTVGLGGEIVLQQAGRNAKYQHWATWGDEADANLTDTEIRETLVERAALADASISSASESAMQTSLDSEATAQPNALCCIEIEAVSGGGDFTLTTDKTFDPLASIHYRYNGTTDTLTLVNTSGGDASIVSAPYGGNIVLATRQTLTVTVLDAVTKVAIEGARIYIVAGSGGDLTENTIIMNEITNSSGVATASFDYTNDQPIKARVRKGSSAPYYKTATIGGPLTSTPLDTTVLMISDE